MAAAGGGGGAPPGPACAACKYQRRRCAADCPLAPYFPHDRPGVFRSAHRLFGVSNILKTLERAGPDPARRHEAMQCVVYESQAWDLYPSAGCVPIILALQRQIQQTEHELRRVHADLQAYRRRADGNIIVAQDGAATGHYSAKGIPAAGGDERQQMMAMTINDNAAVTTNNDGYMLAPPPQMLPATVQQQQYEHHPFFVDAMTMVPDQFHYQQQQPIVAVSTKLPELLQDDDTMNYFADGINGGNDDETMPRKSSTDSSGDPKRGENATRNAPKMKDNNDFIKQDVN